MQMRDEEPGPTAAPDLDDAQVLVQVRELQRAGRTQPAERLCRRLLAADPGNGEAHFQLGLLCEAEGRFAEAEASYRRAMDVRPRWAVAHNNLGSVLFAQGKLEPALAGFRRAAELEPGMVEAHHNLGRALQELGRLDEAAAGYRQAIALRPDSAEAHNNLGNVLSELGRFEEAVTCYRRALGPRPDDAKTHNNLGNALRSLGRLGDAEAHLRRAIGLAPRLAPLQFNLANVLADAGRLDDALAGYDLAVALDPAYARAYHNRGNVLKQVGRSEEAMASFRRAIQLDPNLAEAHHNLGHLLQEANRSAEAIQSYRRAVQLKPDYADAVASLAHELRIACDWHHVTALDADLDRLTARALAEGRRPGETPFMALARSSDPARHLEIARAWAGDMMRQAAAVGLRFDHEPRRRPKERLTIGYLSADFRDHPATRAILGVLAAHDRERFRVVGYAYGRDDGGSCRVRVRSSCDAFVDVTRLSLADAARRIHADGVDILVDLTGHTRDTRTAICTFRPAPIQVSYLGFPGTSGAGFIDYLLTDSVVSPSEHRVHYAEALVYLPGTFLALEPIAAPAGEGYPRALFGLPDGATVFCSFNAPFKITRATFEVWMRILHAVPNGVLWLARANPLAERHLRRAARAGGVNEERIVFADRLPYERNLRRLELADLGLDTLTYNGGVTTSNALWAGVPVLCCEGTDYVSRMSASLVRALGLPELVAPSVDAYQALAVRLARDPVRRAEIRQRLRRNRAGSPAFDPPRLARAIEAAYREMWARFARGEPAREIALAAAPPAP